MKKSILVILGIVILLPPLFALSEFTAVQQPTIEQQCVLMGIEREISEVQKEIQLYYKDLSDNPCAIEEGGDPRSLNCKYYKIDKKNNNISIIPLTTVVQSYYGLRTKYILAEQVYIKWAGEKIQSFRFMQRRSIIGSGSVIKTLSGDSAIVPGMGVNKGEKAYSLDVSECMKMKPEERKPVGKPLNLFVKEVFHSGTGSKINFRFPTTKVVRDKNEEMMIDGKKVKVQVVYVRNFNQRISISREYLRLLKLTLRRIDWNSRAAAFRKASEIQRILESK